MKQYVFRAGDPVLVRSHAEILATLDADGTLDGVPFMPEMLNWCGKPYRVQRRVEKTCVDGYPLRRFPANDVLILDGPRCDGRGHDGCKHGCRIFWKEAWLRPADIAADEAPAMTQASFESLRARLKVKADAQRYFCQSTELLKATESFSGTRRLLTVRIALREIRSGDLTAVKVVRLFLRWIAHKILRTSGVDKRLRGPGRRTAKAVLRLRPGDPVRVKNRGGIIATLNQDRRNRGLGICYEMTRCCKSDAQVRYRVDRLIDERTGLMREISDTVTLRNIGSGKSLGEECLCARQLGDCPRGELMYWREVWLERSSQT